MKRRSNPRESDEMPNGWGALPYVLGGVALLVVVAAGGLGFGAYYYLSTARVKNQVAVRPPAPVADQPSQPPREQGERAGTVVVDRPAEQPAKPAPRDPEPAPKPEPPPDAGPPPIEQGPASKPPREAEPAPKPEADPKPPSDPKPEPLVDGHGTRSAEVREKLLKELGGTEASEAAVARGLQWLALHQSADWHWSLEAFQRHAHERPGLNGKIFTCNCGGQGMRNDTAGTSFGVLPFLGAGIAPRSANKTENVKEDYTKNVDAALKYLISHQDAKTGDFGGGMYAHGLATIVVCEAYGLSLDQQLKVSAQKAIDFIVMAQDPAGGGWRYTPRQGGDTSVLGWQMMALKSGQLAGLKVPKATLAGAAKWLDSCEMGTIEGGDFGYGYIDKKKGTPATTAIGLLCRQNLGWTPQKPELVAGVKNVKQHLPGGKEAGKSMYFNYYATQVMFHTGGDSWNDWNPKMRDQLVRTQDPGRDVKKAHQVGSWGSEDDFWLQGGRVMQTSLSLLTLEVYYRHAPLYRVKAGAEDGDKK